jgi:hypothetical protein
VLLYVFILRRRTATKDIGGAPQESIILGAAEADACAEYGLGAARFLVITSPELPQGSTIEVTSATVVGRDQGSGIRLTATNSRLHGMRASVAPRRCLSTTSAPPTAHTSTARAYRAPLRTRRSARGKTELQVQR